MELDEESSPSQIMSLLNGRLTIVELSKKRKLGAELLGLPTPKHQCSKHSLPSRPPTFCSIPEVEGFDQCTFKGKEGNSCDVSETGSAKDSNSFGEDSETMSLPAEEKFVKENANYSLYDHASSSLDRGSSFQGSNYSSGVTPLVSSGVGKEGFYSPGVEPKSVDVELVENLKEYGSHIDYIYSACSNYTIEEYQDKEIDEILNSNGANPNVYVLSSGRWSVNQDAPQTKRKPTIDQEFEQYFSMLML